MNSCGKELDSYQYRREIGRRRWKWVGHTLRKGKNSITRLALQWNPQGSRGRGRPRGDMEKMHGKRNERCWHDVGGSKQESSRQGYVEDVFSVAYTLTGMGGNDDDIQREREKERERDRDR